MPSGLQLDSSMIKRRLQRICFPVKFDILLRASFFTNHLWWLLMCYEVSCKDFDDIICEDVFSHIRRFCMAAVYQFLTTITFSFANIFFQSMGTLYINPFMTEAVIIQKPVGASVVYPQLIPPSQPWLNPYSNQWTGFYMITASLMKGLTTLKCQLNILHCVVFYRFAQFSHYEKFTSSHKLISVVLQLTNQINQNFPAE